MILQRYSLGETIFEVPRTNFTYREVEEKVPRKYREYREIAGLSRFAVRGTFPMDRPSIIMNEISLQKQEQEHNQQPQPLSPEELQEKHIKQYLGGLYPKVDRQFHPLYLRDTLHPREIDPKLGEVVDGDIPFFW